MRPCILHLDIDAFFASVEQARNPNLRGKPVIVGSGVIASCSYEARAFGLHAGMPLSRAARLCPEAVVLEGHYPTYRCFSDKVFELCHQFAPHVETHLDEAYCDLTGTEGLYGHPSRVGRLLKETIRAETGLSVSIGIATNRFCAQMASSAGKPDGLVVVEEGTEAEFVRELPVEDLPGIGHSRLDVLRKLNIATIGELRQLDQEALTALFGRDGLAIYERCRGRDSGVLESLSRPPALRGDGSSTAPRSFSSDAERRGCGGSIPPLSGGTRRGSISRETAFHEDTADTAAIEGMLYYLTERAARAMRDLGLQCRTVAVRLRYCDGQGDRKSRSLSAPTQLDSELFTLAREILGQLHRRRVSIHAIGVQLSNFSKQGGRQTEMFRETDPAKLGRLYACLDRLRNRFGHSVVATGKCLEAMGGLKKDRYGFVLRTPCLTK